MIEKWAMPGMVPQLLFACASRMVCKAFLRAWGTCFLQNFLRKSTNTCKFVTTGQFSSLLLCYTLELPNVIGRFGAQHSCSFPRESSASASICAQASVCICLKRMHFGSLVRAPCTFGGEGRTCASAKRHTVAPSPAMLSALCVRSNERGKCYVLFSVWQEDRGQCELLPEMRQRSMPSVF